jgi:hypothetical protein
MKHINGLHFGQKSELLVSKQRVRVIIYMLYRVSASHAPNHFIFQDCEGYGHVT